MVQLRVGQAVATGTASAVGCKLLEKKDASIKTCVKSGAVSAGSVLITDVIFDKVSGSKSAVVKVVGAYAEDVVGSAIATIIISYMRKSGYALNKSLLKTYLMQLGYSVVGSYLVGPITNNVSMIPVTYNI